MPRKNWKDHPLCHDTFFYLSSVEIAVNGCWLWQYAKDRAGYGRYGPLLMHRESYRHFKGAIPQDLCVMHSCDIPACINPAHLSLGTRLANNRDRELKGRGSKGQKWHQARPRKKASHCKAGHALTPDNRYRGTGQCLKCKYESIKQWKARNGQSSVR